MNPLSAIKTEICLVSQSGDRIMFKKGFEKLSDLISNSELDEDIPLNEISTEVLNKIKQFCELHNYDSDSMTFTFPFNSDKLKDHVDEKSYEFLSEYDRIQDHQQKIKELAPLLEAGFYLGFTKFKKIINICIQVSFYCGMTAEEQTQFKEKWKICDEDLTDDIQKEITTQYYQLYKGYSSALKSELESVYKKYQAAKKK